jgi:sugar phosphate isomerase/epimerase
MKISMVTSSGLGFPLRKGSLEGRNLSEVEGVFSQLSELGYDGVELSIEEPAKTNHRGIAEISERYGIEVPAIGTGLLHKYKGLSLSAPKEVDRRRAIRALIGTIDIAACLGSLAIVGLVRGKMGTQRLKRIEAFRKSMIECDEAAGRMGVSLALEPLNRYEADYVNNVDEALSFLLQAGLHNTGLLLDTFHMNIEEVSIEGSIRKAGGRISHIHVADSNRLAPGLGHLPFRDIIGAAVRLGYDRYLSAEIMASPNPVRDSRITIDKLRNILG